MDKNIFTGQFRGIKFSYTHHSNEDDSNGILIIDLENGVQSTHIIKNWGIIRIMQYIESMSNLV